MQYLNLQTTSLHAPEFIGSDPMDRGVWICLCLWSAQQENGGRIKGAASWNDRRWQQTCGVTFREVRKESQLFKWEGEDLIVWNYPVDKEALVKAKRGTARSNGQTGGRPPTKPKVKPASEPTLVSNIEPMSESGREEEEEGNENIASASAAAVVDSPSLSSSDPEFLALCSFEGTIPGDLTQRHREKINHALREIRGASPGVNAVEIGRRGKAYVALMPTAQRTAHGLSMNWARFGEPPVAVMTPSTSLPPPTSAPAEWREIAKAVAHETADEKLRERRLEAAQKDPWESIHGDFRTEVLRRSSKPAA